MSSVGLTYVQGYRARSWVEYSLLKKYVYSAVLVRIGVDFMDTDISCSSLLM